VLRCLVLAAVQGRTYPQRWLEELLVSDDDGFTWVHSYFHFAKKTFEPKHEKPTLSRSASAGIDDGLHQEATLMLLPLLRSI
jgi:hypothetical protein